MKLRKLTVASSTLALLLASSGAAALNLEFSGGLHSEYSSNMPRTYDSESDLLTEVWAGASLQESTALWQGQLAGVIGYEEYLDDTVDDDFTASLAALLDVTLLPGRLSWHVENYYQQIDTDILEPSGRRNRQNSNVLWTGPDLRFRFARLYHLDIGARYGDYYYEETPGDNERQAVLARFSRRLSEQSEIYLMGETMKVEYEDPGTHIVTIPEYRDEAGERLETELRISDFDRHDVFAGYRYNTTRSELQIDAGYSRIERDAEPDVDGPLFGVSLSRDLARNARIGIELSRRYSESGEALLNSGGFRLDPDLRRGTVVEDIMKLSRATLHFASGVTGEEFRLRLFTLEEEYETIELLSRQITGVSVERNWRLAPLWGLRVGGEYRYSDYDYIDVEDDDILLRAEATHRLTRRLRLEFGLGAYLRESNQDLRDFDEYVALVSLVYGERPSWSDR